MDLKCSLCSSPCVYKCHERAFCVNCVAKHISSDISSTHILIHPGNPPDLSCKLCQHPADLQCQCTITPSLYCSLCFSIHVNESLNKSHKTQLLWQPEQVDKKYPKFLELVKKVDFAREKIKENLKLIDTFDSRLEDEYEVVKNNIISYYQDVQNEVDKAENYLNNVIEELEECKKNSEASELALMQRHNFQPSKGRGIKLFEGNLDDDSCIAQLKALANIAIKGESGVNDYRLYLIKARSKEILIYDLLHKTTSKKPFGKLVLKDSGSWCEIPNKKIFYCGGVQGPNFTNEAFIIDPFSMTSIAVPPMNQSRALSSVVYYKGKIYVFGGYSGSNLSSCEVYDIKKETWRIISDMPIGRSAFSVVEYNGFFYMAGDSTSIDRYDPKNDCFLTYENVLTSTSNYLTMAIFGDSLFLQQNNTCLEVDINRMVVKEAYPTSQGKWWSYFPAKLHDDQIYFSRYDDSGIWAINVKTKLVNKIKY